MGGRDRVEREALEEFHRGMDALGLCCTVGAQGDHQQGTEREEAHSGNPGQLHWMITRVPTGISRESLRMSTLRMRMQPWEMAPGMRSGRSVPWMPT